MVKNINTRICDLSMNLTKAKACFVWSSLLVLVSIFHRGLWHHLENWLWLQQGADSPHKPHHWKKWWKTLCFVPYSNRSFLGSDSIDPRQVLYSYEMDLESLMELGKDYYEAEIKPSTSMSSGESTKINTIMHCAYDIISCWITDCNISCLRTIVGANQNRCRGKQGSCY